MLEVGPETQLRTLASTLDEPRDVASFLQNLVCGGALGGNSFKRFSNNYREVLQEV